MAAPDPEVSIVIPLLDEEENVGPLYDELTGVLLQMKVSHELILIDEVLTSDSSRFWPVDQ